MLTLYHNPRCRKSREGLQILENSGKDFTIKYYLKDALTATEIKRLLSKLEIPAMDLVRANEAVWKSEFKNREVSESELLKVLADHPQLIQRPIVETTSKAVIGRPPERIKSIL